MFVKHFNDSSVIIKLLERSKDVMLTKHFNESSVIILLLQRFKDVMLTNVRRYDFVKDLRCNVN